MRGEIRKHYFFVLNAVKRKQYFHTYSPEGATLALIGQSLNYCARLHSHLKLTALCERNMT